MFDERTNDLRKNGSSSQSAKSEISESSRKSFAWHVRFYKVEAYGQKMPINQIGNITTPDPHNKCRSWDASNVSLVDSL